MLVIITIFIEKGFFMSSTFWWVILLASVVGVLIALQGQMLGGMSSRNLGYLVPSVVNYFAGIIFLLFLLPFQKIDWAGLAQMPWYFWSTGVCGVIIVSAIGLAVEKIGVVSALTVLIVTQVTASAVLDQFGILGEIHLFTLSKMAGTLTIFFGLWLIIR